MPKKSYVKCQLLMGNIERDVLHKISRIRQPYFDHIVEKIKKSIFRLALLPPFTSYKFRISGHTPHLLYALHWSLYHRISLKRRY